MKTTLEPEKNLPVILEVDVVVLGGSCTGVFAAVRAARLGMQVALVEKQNCFGGMATAGDVYIWHSLYDTVGERRIIAGLTLEVIERLHKRGAVRGNPSTPTAFGLNTEELKIELDELVLENRIEPFLHTLYTAPVMQEGRLAGVIIENKNGRQVISGSQFVDATGDADLAHDLGLPCRISQHLQPPTTGARIQGLETLGGFDWTRAVREHGREFGLRKDWGWGGSVPGLADTQFRADSHVFDCDASDAQALTLGEIEGRRQVRAIMDLIRKYGPPEASIGLADLAASLGIRQTRSVAARYRLTGPDVLEGTPFEDAIANGSYRVDIHHAQGPGITFRYLDGTEAVIHERGAPAVQGRWRPPTPENPVFYQIPWRCLLPEHVANLVLAGRMLDADETAFSAARVMVNMNQTGEAAGTACALAVAGDCDVCNVSTQTLREKLAAGGSIVLAPGRDPRS